MAPLRSISIPVRSRGGCRLPPTSISSEALSLRLPFRQRRRGVESRLVIGAGQPARDDILISNIARASAWREALCKGEDLATIAARDGITVKYLGQMLVFAFPVSKARPRDPSRSSATSADHELDPPPRPSGILGRTGPHHRAALSIPRIAKSTLEKGLLRLLAERACNRVSLSVSGCTTTR